MLNDNSTPGDVKNVKSGFGKNHRKHKKGHGGQREILKKDGFQTGLVEKFYKRSTE